MGLLKILKTVIGLGGSGSRSTSGTAEPGRENVDVAVEHEPEPDTTSEDAVKGTGEEPTADADTASTPAAEPETTGEPDEEFPDEDATAPEAEADDAESATDDAEPETGGVETEPEDTEAETDATDTGDADTDDSEIEVENANASTDTIKGIGPSYAETLADAGIETVGDLAAADAEGVADGTDISEKRVGRWIARARGDDE